MAPAERRARGAHYTTEKNILKVIEPLFMDDLRSEFARLKSRKDSRRVAELRRFQAKLGDMTFFDPACGCGNFLIIAYRELRLLEIDVIREIRQATATTAQALLDAAWQSVVDVDQFHGIEPGEFPARIAETALWMMDHIMNNRLSLEFGRTCARIPLERAPHIVHGDALEADWPDLLPSADCSFVLGNPPFVGAKYQTAAQRAQVRGIAALGRTGGTLDYVAAWFIRAGEYARGGKARIGFVATNSITQGEQAAQLWPVLFQRCRLEIAFAHRTFAWGSDARGTAHVHVVIIGLDRREAARSDRRLFGYPDINGEPEESRHAALSPYLVDAGGLSDPHLTVREESGPNRRDLPPSSSGAGPTACRGASWRPSRADGASTLPARRGPGVGSPGGPVRLGVRMFDASRGRGPASCFMPPRPDPAGDAWNPCGQPRPRLADKGRTPLHPACYDASCCGL